MKFNSKIEIVNSTHLGKVMFVIYLVQFLVFYANYF